MIYSRTAKQSDIESLELISFLKYYMGIPKKEGDYKNSQYKFWDYTLLVFLIENHIPSVKKILNISINGDIVLDNILSANKIEYTTCNPDNILKLSVRDNKFDIICILGVLEHTNIDLIKLLTKISKHINIGGYIIITTDEDSEYHNRYRAISVDDLLNMSLILEKLGYDFVSDSIYDFVDYDNNSKLHSLVMQRVGK